MKKYAAFVLAAALTAAGLGGCKANPDADMSKPSPSFSEASSEKENPAASSEEEKLINAQMSELAQAYEKSCGGGSIADRNAWELTIYFIEKDGRLEDYFDTDENCYRFDSGVMEQVSSFLTDAPAAEGEDTMINYARDFNLGYDIELTLKSAKKDESGNITAYYTRKYNGMPLNDVEYTFAPAAAEKVPQVLENYYAEGEKYYKIASVANYTISLNENPKTVEIGTAAELVKLAEDINKSGALRVGNTYLLTADIDMSGAGFEPIGQNRNIISDNSPIDPSIAGFNATFDGQGHTISNLKVESSGADYEYGSGMGLFAAIGQYGTVKNLNVENAAITTANPNCAVGIIAGISSGAISGCTVSGKVVGAYNVGGLVGRAEGIYKSYDAAVNSMSVTNCSVNAEVTGTGAVGGALGAAHSVYIGDCKFDGAVKAVTTVGSDVGIFEAGGFAGNLFFCSIKNCAVSARLNVAEDGRAIGAVIGNAYQSSAENFSYDASAAGEWDLIDWVDDVDAGADNYANYEFIAK